MRSLTGFAVGLVRAGKSTLIKMILGEEQPDAGTISIGDTVRIVSVGQERMMNLNPSKSVFEEITDGLDEITLGTEAFSSTSVQSRAYLSWFGFKGAQQQAIVGNLSGGERNRVQLAKVLKAGGNLICLDEPTNDIDHEVLRSLEVSVGMVASADFMECVTE
jgi:energy-dependent translational throttle protein EttA